MKCKLQNGDIVIPRPEYPHLNRDYFRGESGRVTDIKYVGMDYEKYFVTVDIRGRKNEFYSSALMLVNNKNIITSSRSFLTSLFYLERPLYQLMIYYWLISFLLSFFYMKVILPESNNILIATCISITISLITGIIKSLKQ